MKHRYVATIFLPIWCLWCQLKLGSAQIEMLLKQNLKDATFSNLICEISQTRDAQINILYRNSEREELENWNNLYQCLAQLPLVIRDLNMFPQEPLRSSSSLNIYFITTTEIMEKVVNFLNSQQRWKHGHRYLFVWLIKDLNLLQVFFEKVWQKNILLAVAAVKDSQKIFTFEPFSPQGFQLKIVEHYPYFYDKLQNFYQNEIRIIMFTDTVRAVPIDGNPNNGYKRVDGWVARTLVERLNATARYITPTDNGTYGALINETLTGSLKDIHSGLTHIGFNFRYTLDNVKQHVEELYPYQKRVLYLVVPAAEMRPEYLIFANAFTYLLWRIFLLNFCLIFLIFIILQNRVERLPNYNRKDSPKHWLWYEIIEMLHKTQLGEPVEGFSSNSSLRLFLITWILFSYVLTSIYFAKLESSFVQPMYEQELDNLKDMPQKLKVPIYAFDIVFQTIRVSLEPQYYQHIDANGVRVAQNITANDFALTVIRKHKNVALILSDEFAKVLLAETYNDETKRPSFHIVKEYLRSLTSSYVLTKGSPFIHKFQTLVSAFHEHGFIVHWLEVDSQTKSSYSHNSDEFFEDLEDNFDLFDNDGDSSSNTPQPMQRRKKVVLNLEILQGSFYLWFGGICMSCMGFAIEHFHWWRKRKLNKVGVLKDLNELE